LLRAMAIASRTLSPALSESTGPALPFVPHVDMKTFMEHVLTPAATIIWRSNGVVIDDKGEHDISPKSEADWEQIVSGAATLAEATNARMIPQRVPDQERIFYAQKFWEAGETDS